MKFGVVVFPGSNCDEDLVYTLQNVLGQEVVKLWHKDTSIQGCDFIMVPGGFSYGDYLRSGAIARFSPIMDAVIQHANRGGYVMGICNGFQILTEANLLPGALLHNNSRKFICKNVFLKADNNDNIVTHNLLLDSVFQIPIAHGEGNFFASAEELQQIEDNGQVLFRYCDEQGEVNEAGNPNGSLNNIAGICNAGKNVFGMMPHPERCFAEHLHNADGRGIFESIMAAAGVNA